MGHHSTGLGTRIKWGLLLHLVWVWSAVCAVETPVPERFLQPRDFNPHPLTDVRREPARYKTLHIPEPTDVYAHYVQHREPAYKNEQFLQYAPRAYQELTQASHARFTEQQQRDHLQSLHEHHAGPSAAPLHEHHEHHSGDLGSLHGHVTPSAAPLQALDYPAEDYATARSGHVALQDDHHHDHSYDEHIPKQYAFSYAVLDHHSGDDFSHAQAHNGHSTQGQYRVKLPDGRTQVVHYTADDGGYRAKVSYEPSADPVVVHPSPTPRAFYPSVTPGPFLQVLTTPQPPVFHHSTPYPQVYKASTPYPSVYKASTPYPTVFKASTPYPAIHETATPTPHPPVFHPSTPYPALYKETPYPYRGVTQASVPVYSERFESSTVAPSLHYEHVAPQHVSGHHVPQVHVAYNGRAEEHHVFKRDN